MAITASIVGPTFITVMMDGVTHTINGDHANYAGIREALKAKDHVLVEQLINVKNTLIKFVQGAVRVDGDQVFYGDMEVKGSVVNRILQMVREGFDAQPMLNFLANLMRNPSKRAVDELYGFLEATKLPITEDGHFLAYKKVNSDYRDFYTGKMDNSVGKVLEMPRNQVDDNKDQTCSYGLHFCSLSYLPHYHGGSGRVVIVKIDPADVVSIPSDYNNAKGRAARYEIVGEYEGDDRESRDYFTAPVYSAQVNNVAPAAPAAKVRPMATNTPSPALAGYDQGRSDAGAWRQFNGTDARFTGADADRYLEAYRKGFYGVRNGNASVPSKPVESPEDAYDRGYDAGQIQAEKDSDAAGSYDDTTPLGESSDFNLGYEAGYSDNYYVDWEEVGYHKAEVNVVNNQPYNDEPPPACDDEGIYREGYANGWRDSKIARI
jgi:hypothetical protein